MNFQLSVYLTLIGEVLSSCSFLEGRIIHEGGALPFFGFYYACPDTESLDECEPFTTLSNSCKACFETVMSRSPDRINCLRQFWMKGQIDMKCISSIDSEFSNDCFDPLTRSLLSHQWLLRGSFVAGITAFAYWLSSHV